MDGMLVNNRAVNCNLLALGTYYEIATLSFGFYQEIDERGSPSSGTRLHLVRVALMGYNFDETEALFNWAFEPDQRTDFNVEINIDHRLVRSIRFEDAYCVGIKQTVQLGESTSRPRELHHLPTTEEIRPRHRGRDYFSETTSGLFYELVLAATRIITEDITIPA